jgi:hypothetical protein
MATEKTRLPIGVPISDSATQQTATIEEDFLLKRAAAALHGNARGNAAMFGGGAAGCVVQGPHVAAWAGNGEIPSPDMVTASVDPEADPPVFTDPAGEEIEVPTS